MDTEVFPSDFFKKILLGNHTDEDVKTSREGGSRQGNREHQEKERQQFLHVQLSSID
jgi:hypothetical protein